MFYVWRNLMVTRLRTNARISKLTFRRDSNLSRLFSACRTLRSGGNHLSLRAFHI